MSPRFLRLIVLAPLLALLLSWSLTAEELSIYFVDVGQGDATLVVGPDGTTLLIDGGNTGCGRDEIKSLLVSLGIGTLDFMVASHYHADHIGGLDEVVAEGYLPGVAYDRGTWGGTPGTYAYQDYSAAVSAVRFTIDPGDVIALGDGATATCVVVNGLLWGGGSVNISGSSQFENSASVGLLIEYGDFDYLTMGDLTGGGYSTPDVELPVGNRVGDVDVHHASHHGSSTSSSLAFVQTITPDLAIVSSGENNGYGHPTVETLLNLSSPAAAIPILQTTSGAGAVGGVDMPGTFEIRTDGTDYTVLSGGVPHLALLVDESATAQPEAGDLLIAEYMHDPAAADDASGEYVEIFNPTTDDLSLEGLEVSDNGYDSVTFASNLLVPAGERVVVGNGGHPALNGGYTPSAVWPESAFGLDNGVDEIFLSHGSTEVDGLLYDGGATYPDPTGRSVERIDLLGATQGSNFAAATTSFGSGDDGTPGGANSVDDSEFRPLLRARSVPFPGSTLNFTLHAYSHGLEKGFAGLALKGTPGFYFSGVHIPLKNDWLFQYAKSDPALYDDLDENGKGEAAIDIPANPSLTGMHFYAALIVFEPGPVVIDAQETALHLVIE